MEKHDTIVVADVVSLGAAPPETLSILVDHLTAKGLTALSFNHPTLAGGIYGHILDNKMGLGHISLVSQENGPHLQQQKMGSDVIMLKRL